MQKKFAIFMLVLSSLCVAAQSSSVTQKTLITKRTATWCPNCGTWGWDMAKSLEELQNENAIIVRAHYSGILESKVAIDITENFDAIYQPEFYINEERQNVGSSTWPAQVQVFDDLIDANAKKEANVVFNIASTFQENVINADVKIEISKPIDGEYFLAAYLVEDNIVANQASQGEQAVHNSVLRASFTEGSFGDQVIDSSADKGFIAELKKMMEVDGEEVLNRAFRVLAVVWKKVGTKYQIENVHEAAVGEFSSTSEGTEKQSEFRIYQTGQSITVEDLSDHKSEVKTIDVYTLSGSKIASQTMVKRDFAEISIDANNFLGQLVLVSISNDRGRLFSKKLIIR